ncbi:Eco57I restriction-modification methylase domain-containing protein [Ligilactobacillus salivarius]|uniref:Eco57I restriction-modification methylase domain-containing protein n=1 Tax=Ligilactobacillus salivarius TaxID=1624 RepID=UPI002360B0E2|nr:N-6 DNA methylase [Ligilactobacillus salivarius]MDD1403712.1 N-6 DNA methylase [Ligilactobacillus salivarius]
MNKIAELNDIVNGYIKWLYENDSYNVARVLEQLIVNTFKEIHVDPTNLFSIEYSEVSNSNISKKLSDLSEFTSDRKKRGVYYTPTDLVDYMLYNASLKKITPLYQKSYNTEDIMDIIVKQNENLIFNYCTKTTIFDPTCGSGEFILQAIKLKIRLLQEKSIDSKENVVRAISTIYGNDMDNFAILILKLRICIYLANIISLSEADKISNILNDNFYISDFVFENKIRNKFDIIVGNPPYVEYRNLLNKPKENFGNLYANILSNSMNYLNDGGLMSYVIPISFSSTKRMSLIRKKIFSNFKDVILLHFADRPASLFTKVHQKLDIIIAYNFNGKLSKLYTSQYNYSYKKDRENIFNNIEVVENDNYEDEFIPKYGNRLQKSIYNKVLSNETNINVLKILSKTDKYDAERSIFLSKRATFFIKSFLRDPKSKEYTLYEVDVISNKVLLAILNSSLFWFYWNIVSDGWHIVNKDLSYFKIPDISKIQQEKLSKLADKLIDRLEKTKVYVGTVQTEFEYKHRYAFDILDEIDTILADIYNLDEDELLEVKNFARKYRGG